MDSSYDMAAYNSEPSMGAMIVPMIIGLVFIGFMVAAMWKVFTKAGQPGWAAIVPIYNLYVMLQIVGRPAWWLALYLLAVIPFVGSLIVMVLGINIAIDMAKSFGKGAGFGIGLAFLGPIFYAILGFGSAQYVGPAAAGGSSVARA